MATVALSGIITPTNVVTAASTTTLTNKTISGASNTISNIPLSTAVTGNLPVTNLNSGTSASASTFWRGDGAWAAPSGGFTLGTPVAATSGTSITFTGIPAGTKLIVISFVGVSFDAGYAFIVQLGDAGGIETTGYLGSGSRMTSASSPTIANYTTGFGFAPNDGAELLHGQMVLALEDSSDFTWTARGGFSNSAAAEMFLTNGSKALSQQLDRVRITSTNGAGTFDAGEINISYI